MEQSPSEEKQHVGAEQTLQGQGTIVGEIVSLPKHDLNQTSTTISKQSLAALSFHDHSTVPTEELDDGAVPSWSIYQSPVREMNSSCRNVHREDQRLNFNRESNHNTRPTWTVYQESDTGTATAQTGPNEKPILRRVLGDIRPDQSDSSLPAFSRGETTTSDRPGWNVYQSPESFQSSGRIKTARISLAASLNSNQNDEPGSRRLSVFRGVPEQHNSSSLQWNSGDGFNQRRLSVFQEIQPSSSEGLNSSSRPNWSIYQGLERSNFNEQVQKGESCLFDNSRVHHGNLNGELQPNSVLRSDQLNSSRLNLLKESRPDQTASGQLDWSTYQSPERTGPMSSIKELNPHRLGMVQDIRPDQMDMNNDFNSSRRFRSDHMNSSSYQPIEINQDDHLLPKQSFCQRNSQHRLSIIHQQLSFTAPQSPNSSKSASQDVPMSPDPADRDIMAEDPPQSSRPNRNLHSHPLMFPEPLLEQTLTLLANRRRSERPNVRLSGAVEKSAASDPVQGVPASPDLAPRLSWVCPGSPVKETEPDLDVLMVPHQSKQVSGVMDVPMSPVQPSCPGTGHIYSVLCLS